MTNPTWLFVLASLIAVIGILFSYKQLMAVVEERIERKEIVSQESFQKEMSRFFIKVPIIEIIPILLVVFGFIQLGEAAGTGEVSDIILPFGVILLVFVFAVINVISLRGRVISINEIDSQSKAFVNTLSFIGVALLGALPIISFVAMMLYIG
jgi:hypothetical protein